MTAVAPYVVMPGHGRPKDGIASLAYVPGIHVAQGARQSADARVAHGRWESSPRRLGNAAHEAATQYLASLRLGRQLYSGSIVIDGSVASEPRPVVSQNEKRLVEENA
jgi:hypothetical protein